MIRKLIVRIGLLAAVLIGSPAYADSQSFGEYQLHYNALPSSLLPETVARENGILRSRARGVLLLSVQRQGEAVPASVRITATDSDQQPVAVELRRIRSGASISYLGSFPIRDGQQIRFRLEVVPEGSSETLYAGFTRQFFVD